MNLYAPEGKFLWDFWIYEEDGIYHLFHLEASLSDDSHSRHRNSSVGYAISKDLINWEYKGTVLKASDLEDDWDSVSIWTGCTIKKDDTYYMFYTSRCKRDVAEDGYVGHTQRIGVATSKDLINWEKYRGNPIIVADERYYEKQMDAYNKHEGCRDPFVVYDEDEKMYYAFFTARDKNGHPKYRGCIGRARSKDLINWEVMPPAASPHIFTDMEVPSLHKHNGKWYMIFAVKKEWYSPEYIEKIYPMKPQTGVLYFVSDSLSGEFKPLSDDIVLCGNESGLYTGRIIKSPQGEDVFLSWHVGDDEGFERNDKSYRLSLPIKVEYDLYGRMRLQTALD